MNVTKFLLNVRDRLDEATANVWSNHELMRYGHAAARYMMRRQADVDPSYHNYELALPKTLAIAVTTTGVDFRGYELPSWVYRVTTCRETGGDIIPFRTIYNRSGRFWTYDRFNRIRTSSVGAADLVLDVAKDPAPLLTGTVAATPAPTSTTIHANVTTLGPLVGVAQPEILRGTNDYANSVVEFSGVDTVTHLIQGVRRRVTASAIVVDGGAFFLRLTFETPLTVVPVAGDTFEFLPEVHAAHSELLVLLTCKKAYLKKSNLQQLQAMQEDLNREEARFIDSITPRQDQDAVFVNMSLEAPLHYDPDRDFGGL